MNIMVFVNCKIVMKHKISCNKNHLHKNCDFYKSSLVNEALVSGWELS